MGMSQQLSTAVELDDLDFSEADGSFTGTAFSTSLGDEYWERVRKILNESEHRRIVSDWPRMYPK